MLALGVGVGRLGFLSQRDVSSRLTFDLALRLDRPDVAARIAQQAIGRAWSSMRSVVGVRGLSGERRRLWDEALERYGALRRELNALSLDDFRGRREAQVVARARREALEARSHAALRDALELVGTTEPPKPSPVAPGTVRLTYFPGRTEWFAVVETTDRTRFVSLGGWRPGASDADALRAERLLRPVAHALDTARRVEIVPHPWLQAIDFHALDLEDAPLVTRVPVVYSMLHGARDADGDPAGAEVRTVLVVADPTGDLPEARREGQAIAARYAEDRAYRVQLLMGPEAAASRLVDGRPTWPSWSSASCSR